MKCDGKMKLEQVVSMLKEIPAVNEVSLFGSRARKTHEKGSDFDIMVWCNPDIKIPKSVYKKIFSLPKKFDIKFIDDRRYYGDIMWVFDRNSWSEQGTPISVNILEDMKTLWKRKKRRLSGYTK